jgi:hypothetical protein
VYSKVSSSLNPGKPGISGVLPLLKADFVWILYLQLIMTPVRHWMVNLNRVIPVSSQVMGLFLLTYIPFRIVSTQGSINDNLMVSLDRGMSGYSFVPLQNFLN